MSPPKVTPKPDLGYLYLYGSEDGTEIFDVNVDATITVANLLIELIHLCWRKRDTPEHQPELDLVMIPGDGNFLHYDSEQPTAKTNGRIYVLKFNSSSQRYLFWLQSPPENHHDYSNLSERDRKITDIVYSLLQGEEVDINAELAELDDDEGDDYEEEDEDEDMEDAQEPKSASGTTGGAGADATGGDVRDEGEDAREGGADGGRA